MDCVRKCDAAFRVGDFPHTQCVSYCGDRATRVAAQVGAPGTNAVLNIVLLALGAALLVYGVRRLP